MNDTINNEYSIREQLINSINKTVDESMLTVDESMFIDVEQIADGILESMPEIDNLNSEK